MHPILIPGLPIHTFGVMVLLGVLAGLWWVRHDAPRLRLDPEDTVSVAVEVFLAGLIGSRLQFVLHNWEQYAQHGWYRVFFIWEGGLVWYGGFIAAVPVAIWRLRHYGFPVLRTCDLLAPCTIIGLGIGRIGCLMAGDDHGRMYMVESQYQQFLESELPQRLAAEQSHMTVVEWVAKNEPSLLWVQSASEIPWYALTFKDPRALVGDGYRFEPLFPSQPLMTIKCFVIAGILILLRKRLTRAPGALAALLFVLYPIGRFLIEFTRGDLVRGVYEVAGFRLSMSQLISILVFPLAVAAFVAIYLRGRREWDRLVAEGKDPMPPAPLKPLDPEKAAVAASAPAASAPAASAPAAKPADAAPAAPAKPDEPSAPPGASAP